MRDNVPPGERKEFRSQLEQRDMRGDAPAGEQDERKEFILGLEQHNGRDDVPPREPKEFRLLLEECNVKDDIPPGEQKSSDRSYKSAIGEMTYPLEDKINEKSSSCG